MKGLLLRVGIDKGFGGCLAPIFNDMSFEYIPIPEIQPTSENKVYANMIGINKGIPLVRLVPEKIKYSHPHNDPEFETFTYGDPTKPKRNQLSRLSRRDLLVFYAGLEPKNFEGKPRLFVIGYFDVENIYDFSNDDIQNDYESVFKKLQNNAHSKVYYRLKKELNIEYSGENLVIVEGNPESSKLFTKALPIGANNDKILPELEDTFGYKGSLKRAIGHKIDEKHIHKVKKWLENEGV